MIILHKKEYYTYNLKKKRCSYSTFKIKYENKF